MPATPKAEAPIRFTGLNLVAADVDATVAFYRRLGVSISATQVWRTASGPHHVSDVDLPGPVSFEIDSPALAAVYNAGSVDDPGRAGDVLGFQVGSRAAVDALHDRLVADGSRSVQPPYDAFWGARYAIVTDPDGRHVGLMSRTDDSHITPPPNL